MLAGILVLRQEVHREAVVRGMLRGQLEESRADCVTAEREFSKATALAAGYFHDLELLRHEVSWSSTQAP